MEYNSRMDISSLQAFLVVAESGSFSLAAQNLHLTQPAISKRVASLESELGNPLFDRIGRQIRLTDAGQTLLPRARQIIDEVKDCRLAISNLRGQVQGRISIGTSHHVGLHHLPVLLKTFKRDYPDVELDIRFLASDEACQQVEQGDIELAIVTLPMHLPPRLQAPVTWPDPLCVVSHTEHPLSRSKGVSATRLAPYPAILPTRGTYTRDIVEELFEQQQQELQVHLSTNYLETIKMLVSVGLGWSVLPERMLDASLTRLDKPSLGLSRTLGAIHHRSRTLSNGAQVILRMLLPALEEQRNHRGGGERDG